MKKATLLSDVSLIGGSLIKGVSLVGEKGGGEVCHQLITAQHQKN